ncbi:arsenate reductase (glutaredoxin) [Corynebacterium hindlerae]|uniref:Arsenate reductase (Glutaredoxin) n=1 Tax=Corynebacterium hindlerae TaxID=699041 RepID=A0A7G5FGD1_9CORY|nr:arsenate reductase (glutaredoxin) [Corynebacterium hindlerae]QMV85672.1 arsenate reductase (glutaredoxin) [Corynebacterium hindlerae]
MDITVYHNTRCSKSRSALAYLAERGLDCNVVEYLKTPLTAAELSELLDRAGLSPHDAIRTREAEYKELGLSPTTPPAELIDAMVAHPKLIERPIVATPKGVRIARPTEVIQEIL